MRTTVTFDSDVYDRLRERAQATGKSLRTILNEAVRLGLQVQQPRVSKPLEIKTFPMGLREGFSYDNVAELLDQVDGPARR